MLSEEHVPWPEQSLGHDGGQAFRQPFTSRDDPPSLLHGDSAQNRIRVLEPKAVSKPWDVAATQSCSSSQALHSLQTESVSGHRSKRHVFVLVILPGQVASRNVAMLSVGIELRRHSRCSVAGGGGQSENRCRAEKQMRIESTKCVHMLVGGSAVKVYRC